MATDAKTVAEDNEQSRLDSELLERFREGLNPNGNLHNRIYSLGCRQPAL